MTKNLVLTASLILVIMAFSLSLVPAYALTNGDFETGTLTGWTAESCDDYTGIMGTVYAKLCASPADVLVVTPGTDPNVPVSTVHAGSYAAKIGISYDEFFSESPSQIHWESTITQTATVPTTIGQGFLSFWYAVGAMGNHDQGVASGFVLTVKLGGTTVFTATNEAYTTISGSPSLAPGWTWCNGVDCVTGLAYYPWTQVSIDLTAHAGESLTITFLVHYCQASGHSAWAYLDDVRIAENPFAIPEYPIGLPLLAVFMIVAYGLIKRRSSFRALD